MKVAIVTQDVIGVRLAGPAIRALAMARVLADRGHDVQVHSTGDAAVDHDCVVPGRLDGTGARSLAARADVLVVQGDVLDRFPSLGRGGGALVADLYDPFQLEGLVRGVDLPHAARYGATRRALHVLSGQLQRGDFFLCASERQRLFWLGHLDAAGRVNPSTYDADPTMASLLAVAPFGIEDDPPARSGPGLRGRVPGLDDHSRIVLWGGGVYDWLDPLPLIEAISQVRRDIPEVHLVFMGTAHPNPTVRPSAMLASARALVARLGLTGAVTFHDGWVRYEERHNVLLDAEIGASGHLDHVETALSFRTRILDYIWASLPIVTTEGDALGDVVAEAGLGVTVPPGNPDAVAAALRSLLLDGSAAADARAAIRAIAPSMRWSETLRPLVDFCTRPTHAADRDHPEGTHLRMDRAPGRSERRANMRELLGSARRTLADEGAAGVAKKLMRRARRV